MSYLYLLWNVMIYLYTDRTCYLPCKPAWYYFILLHKLLGQVYLDYYYFINYAYLDIFDLFHCVRWACFHHWILCFVDTTHPRCIMCNMLCSIVYKDFIVLSSLCNYRYINIFSNYYQISWFSTFTLEWVSDCCLTPNELFFSYFMMRISIFDEMTIMSALYWTNTLSWIFIVLVHWNNSLRGRHVSPLGNIILIPSQWVFALTPYYCVLAEKQQIPM